MAIALTTEAAAAVTCAEGSTLLQVAEGVVYVMTEEHDYVLTPGDSATIPAGERYRRFDAGDEKARWIEISCAG